MCGHDWFSWRITDALNVPMKGVISTNNNGWYVIEYVSCVVLFCRMWWPEPMEGILINALVTQLIMVRGIFINLKGEPNVLVEQNNGEGMDG